MSTPKNTITAAVATQVCPPDYYYIFYQQQPQQQNKQIAFLLLSLCRSPSIFFAAFYLYCAVHIYSICFYI